MTDNYRTRPPAIDSIEEGEFIVLSDQDFHLVTHQGIHAQFTPSVFILTNRRIIIDPAYDSTPVCQQKVGDISLISQTVVDDFPVCQLTLSQVQNIQIYIPNDKSRKAFTNLFDIILTENHNNPATFNTHMLNLRLVVKSSESLEKFYGLFLSEPDSIFECFQTSEAPATLPFTGEDFLQNCLLPFNMFSEVIEDGPHLLASAIVIAAFVLSIVFSRISFGAFIPGVVLFYQIRFAIRKMVGKEMSLGQIDLRKEPKSMALIFGGANTFLNTCNQRLLWENSTSTLEIFGFLVTVLLMFTFFRPSAILGISIVTLAFIERWNPLRIGPLSAILSKLILW